MNVQLLEQLSIHTKAFSSSSSVMIVTILFFLIIPSATPLSFNFNSFDPSNHEIYYEGDATPTNSVIQLTKLEQWRTGHATYAQPMHLWDKDSGSLADFRVDFTFSIDALHNVTHADGIAFYLASISYRMPGVPDGSGIGLVAGDQRTNSTEPFVAIEFDTYHNPWDPDGDHVGIDISSIISSISVPWYSSVMDGKMVDSTIIYNSRSKNLSVFFTGFIENMTIHQDLHYEIDLRDYLPEWVTIGFSSGTGVDYELHTIHSWNFKSDIQNTTTPSHPSQVDKRMIGLVVGIGGTCVLAAGLIWLSIKKKCSRGDDGSIDDECRKGCGVKSFEYDELNLATDDFAEDNKLGEGGFGKVYKGSLRKLNTDVAIKKISEGSHQGIKEYASEVKIIDRLSHKNLVQLIGWCHERGHLLLVYEYMPNGSLDFHLFNGQSLLKWEVRYQIALGLALALRYLHEDYRECVLHRDIKSSNVMLDGEFVAKLGDFGLSRLVDHKKGSQTTEVVAGTFGYMAPEFWSSRKASKQTDVYSFGVVALEIASGRKAITKMADGTHVNLVQWVWEHYATGKLLEAADPRLRGDFDERQLKRLMIVGLWCAHPDFKLRPPIMEAIYTFNVDAQPPDLPLDMPVPANISPPSTSTFSLILSNVNAVFKRGHPPSTELAKPTTYHSASHDSLLNTV